MKKVLSVFLAALMLFAFMAVPVSAAEGDETPSQPGTPYHGTGKANANQAVLKFDLNGGKCKTGLTIYDPDSPNGYYMYHEATEIPQIFYLVPTDISEGSTAFTPGRPVTLPSVTPPSGYSFVGWERFAEGSNSEGAGSYTTRIGSYTIQDNDKNSVVQFIAVYEPAQVEEDTFSKVFDILVKIFGAILGVITGRGTDAGIATMKNLFGGLLG